MTVLYSVILAGGSGSRLWPLSRETFPKQVFKLNNDFTLFQETFLRLTSLVDDKNIITTTNIKHSSAISEQLNELQAKYCRKEKYKLLTEPVCKNTAPSIAIAVKYIIQNKIFNEPYQYVLTVPSDHYIPDVNAFSEFISKGLKLAFEGYIVSFSRETDDINENFGYMTAKKNAKVYEIEKSALKVSEFIEKPSSADDIKKLNARHFINTGIYLFRADIFISELKKHAPSIHKQLEKLTVKTALPSVELSEYEKFDNISIDYALIEKTKKLVTIPFSEEWKDIGSWDSVYDISPKDENGNVYIGKTIDCGSENSLIYSTSKPVVTLGLKDTIVVETEDAVLISDKNDTSGIKNIYKKLNENNSKQKEIHKTVHRPWGYYTVLEEGTGFLTKCIVVNPKAKLSLQLHHHRSEHWIILEGEATVVKDNKTYTLQAGTSIDIGVEEVHSLQNLTSEQIKVLEVQQGDILDENDIERIKDIYGRV